MGDPAPGMGSAALSDTRDFANAKPADEPPPRQQIAKVRLVRLLGRGGMGEVWLGQHQTLGVEVAVKLMLAEQAGRNPAMAVRFVREAQIAAQIDHQNIVRVLDVGEEDDIRYIVMQYIDGGCVADKIADGPLPVAEALRVVWQTAQALTAAAKKNVVHRDIKPQNLMLTREGQVKLADLGLAKQFRAEGAPKSQTLGTTQAGHALGTPYYMSPEQINDTATADGRSDIYSLGATFFHLLTGKVPFPGNSVYDVMKGHLERKPPNLNTIRPDIPLPVQFVVSRMMAKRQQDRYQTPEELVEALERLAVDLNIRLSQTGATQLMPGVAPGGMPAGGSSYPMMKTGSTVYNPLLSGSQANNMNRPASRTGTRPVYTAAAPPEPKSPLGMWIAGVALLLIGAGTMFIFLHEPTRNSLLGTSGNPMPISSDRSDPLAGSATPTPSALVMATPAPLLEPTLPPVVVVPTATPERVAARATATPTSSMLVTSPFVALTPTPEPVGEVADPREPAVTARAVQLDEQHLRALWGWLRAWAHEHRGQFPSTAQEFADAIRTGPGGDAFKALPWADSFAYVPGLRTTDPTNVILGHGRKFFDTDDRRRQVWVLYLDGRVVIEGVDRATGLRRDSTKIIESR